MFNTLRLKGTNSQNDVRALIRLFRVEGTCSSRDLLHEILNILQITVGVFVNEVRNIRARRQFDLEGQFDETARSVNEIVMNTVRLNDSHNESGEQTTFGGCPIGVLQVRVVIGDDRVIPVLNRNPFWLLVGFLGRFASEFASGFHRGEDDLRALVYGEVCQFVIPAGFVTFLDAFNFHEGNGRRECWVFLNGGTESIGSVPDSLV